MQAVLHREVGDRRARGIGLFGHVVAELRVDGVEAAEEGGVLLQLARALHAQLVEEGDRIAVAGGPQRRVDLLEQVAGAGVPAPPEVARQLLEGMQPLGKGLVDHHAVPVGLLGEELLAHEVDLFGVRAAVVERRAAGPRVRSLDRLGISRLVGCEEVLPERRFGKFVGRGAGRGEPVLVEAAEAQQRIGDLRGDLGVVVVVAADHLHARMRGLLLDPEAEAGQRRGDRRHGEGHRLERRVAPRLVVGGVDRDVHAHQQFVVVLVEDAVVAVQVGRHEDHLDLRVGRGEDRTVERAHDRVAVPVLEQMGREAVLPLVDGLRRIGQMGLQVDARTAVAGRHGDVGEHLAVEAVRGGEALERLDEDVEPLVAELVAAARADDQRIGCELAAEAGLRHGDHRAARLRALGVELGARPHDVVLEAVGGHAVRFASEQILALVGRDVAHREEPVEVGRRLLLDRMLGHDVEAAGQLVGVEFRQVVVERQPVAGDAAAHDRGVGGEHRGHIGRMLAQVESAGRRHPLVEMGHGLLRRAAEAVDVGGDHLSGRIAEEHRLDVVPLARDRVDAVILPQTLQDLVLAGNQRREVDQQGDRVALDLPAARTHADALVIEALPPPLQQRGVLLELGIHPLVLQIGTDQDVAVAEFARYGLRLRGDDGVDAAHFVAHLPTDFEQKVGSKFLVTHIGLSVYNLRKVTQRPQR